MSRLDITANRSAKTWSFHKQIVRVLWILSHPIYCCSPEPFWGWRKFLLRGFGGAVGEPVRLYVLGKIEIGAWATVSQNTHLYAGTHDIFEERCPLVKSPILVDSDAWICANFFIGLGVKIGRGAIIGARAVVVRDVLDGDRVAGNPARSIRNRKTN